MHIKFLTLAFAAVALAAPAAEPEAHKRKHHPRPIVINFPVCGGDTVASCCQTDTGVAGGGLNCLSPGNPTSINKFRNFCAATGRTAECCDDLTMGVGTGCQDI